MLLGQRLGNTSNDGRALKLWEEYGDQVPSDRGMNAAMSYVRIAAGLTRADSAEVLDAFRFAFLKSAPLQSREVVLNLECLIMSDIGGRR